MVAARQPVLWVDGIVPGCINAFAHSLGLQWMSLPTVLAHAGAPCLPIVPYNSQLQRGKITTIHLPLHAGGHRPILGCQIRDSAYGASHTKAISSASCQSCEKGSKGEDGYLLWGS